MIKKVQVRLGNREIGEGQPVFIIAEAGVNHNGNVKLARKMIDVAQKAGADAIKFQTFKTEELVVPNAPKARYQKLSTPGRFQFEMLKKLELSESEFEGLFHYCKRKKIIFLSTPFDFSSADFLYKLGVPAFKIGSGDLTNLPLLRHIANYGKPMILSTGMATLQEVKEAVVTVYSVGNKKIILLHCTSNYPTRYEDVNLRILDTLRKFNTPIGYSDHTAGLEVAVAAVAKGVCIIEKHFTLDKNLPGPDHKASLEPGELKKMVNAIRNTERAMGHSIKRPVQNEREISKIARKSIIANKAIPKGTRITRDMLAIKRPGTGIEPKCLSQLLGKRTKKFIGKDHVLTWDLLL